MEEDYPADQLTVEQLRANAFASASANLALLAVNSQKAVSERTIEITEQNNRIKCKNKQ